MDKKRILVVTLGIFVCVIGIISVIKLVLESSTHQAANDASKVNQDGEISDEQVEMLNAKISTFEGILTGKDVMTFILAVNAYNATDTFPYGLEIESIHTEATNGNYSISQIEDNKSYQVSFKYSEDGYITKIIID